MENKYIEINKILVHNLKIKGIKNIIMPRFIKDIAYFLQTDTSLSLSEVNDHLHFLGWEDVELDYHTLQLAIASFERDQSQMVSKKTNE